MSPILEALGVPELPLSTEVAARLRLAHRLSGGSVIRLDHLERAIGAPCCVPLPPTELELDQAVFSVVQRARCFAAREGGQEVELPHLAESLLVTKAQALGLNINRLRLARWMVQHGRYGEGIGNATLVSGTA